MVTGVMTTDLKDPSRYLHGGELVLTGMLWRADPEDSERFVRGIAGAGAVGLAAGEAEVGPVPQDLIDACARHRMPLFAVGEDVAFASLTEFVVRQVSADRAADLNALVERHRLLVSGAGGAGLDAVLELLGGDVDLDCWVLTPTARVIAGPAAGLTRAERDHLVRAHLDAQRRRPVPSSRTKVGMRQFSLLPVPEGTALAQWILVIEGDLTEWTPSGSSSPRTWPVSSPPSAPAATRAASSARTWPTRSSRCSATTPRRTNCSAPWTPPTP
ncbi:PucR family transcriptional regulator ligand-binding domain-containing protein [Streptacidiphilus monticola]